MNKMHVFFYKLLRPLVIVFLWIKFGYTYKKAKNLPDNYIVLSNHTTDYDPLFVASSFPRQMYFVASEHISRWKLAYFFLKHLFEPILRYKGTVAASTVMDVMKKTRKGANVCIFAEGVRSWDGVTGLILSSTGKLVKSSRCGLVTYKIKGGYFTSPAWSQQGTRRGYIHGEPVNVYTKEQLASMTVDEINAVINRDLYEDAYETQAVHPRRYRGKHIAYRMENLLFTCPQCGAHDTFMSAGDIVTCRNCKLKIKYDEYGMLHGVHFKTVKELSDWQKEHVKEDANNAIAYTVKNAALSIIDKQNETLVAEGELSMTPERIKCGEVELPMADIVNMDIHGKHELVFDVDKVYYELVPDRTQNALKFLLYFRACKSK